MDVAPIVTRLQTVGSLAQVVAADPAGSPVTFDTCAALVTLLGSLVAGEMYPLTQREEPVHPSIVYHLVGSAAGEIDGFAVTQTDTHVLSVRAEGYDELFDLVGSIKAALAGSAAAIAVTDLVFDYDDEAELFRCDVEVSYTYLCAASQALPAAYVFSLGRSAQPSAFDTLTKQRIADEYGILILTTAGNVPSLAADIRASLLGWQQSAEHFEMEYASGTSIAGVGGMRLWREIYTDAHFVTQA